MTERKTMTAKLIPLREDCMPVSLFSEHFLAIDASFYAIRMVFCDNTLRVLDSLECHPHETALVSQFVSGLFQKYPCIRIVGSPLSMWPPNLEKVLGEFGVKIEWLSPELMRAAGRALAPWNKRRRLHRAGLLVYLAKSKPTSDYRVAREHILFWEGHMADEILGDVQSEICPEHCEGFAG